MADFFLDEPVAAAPAPIQSDPAADFLAGEQADLAAIDGNVYDQVATTGDEGGFEEFEPDSEPENHEEQITQPEQNQGDFDPFGVQTAPAQTDNDDFFLEQATVTPAAAAFIAPEPVMEAPLPVQPVYTMPKIEPEIIKQWREEFKLRTEQIEADANAEADEWKEAARSALDKFYADREEKMAKTAKLNRDSAEALKVEGDEFTSDGLDSHEKWEHVTQSIDFNAKGSCSKDTTRMRQVLLQLKSGKASE